jgi:uncharacterized RDD family membrane protein YckC
MPAMATTSRTPGAGLPPGIEVGPLGARFGGYLIDHLLPGVIIIVAAVLAPSLNDTGRVVVFGLGALIVAVWAVLVWRMYATGAAGPGYRAVRLQLVGLSDGRPVGWSRFFVRWLVLTLLTATVVGLIAMLVVMALKPRKQGWHDLAANAVVIKRRALVARSARPAVAAKAAGSAGPRSRPLSAVKSAPSPPVRPGPGSPDRKAPAAEPTEEETPTRVVAAAVRELPELARGW